MNFHFKNILFIFILIFISACSTTSQDAYYFESVPWKEVQATEKTPADKELLTQVLKTNLTYLQRRKTAWYQFQKYSFQKTDLINAINTVLQDIQNGHDVQSSLAVNFELLRLNTNSKPLFTGYYTPIVDAKNQRDNKYSIPVYATPKDIVTVNLDDFDEKFNGKILRGRVDNGALKPYWNRKQIMQENKLKDKNLELAWVQNKVDIFYVEIQGSGFLNFPNGTKKLLQYEQQNGKTYRPIGNYLLKNGALDKDHVSMQNIRSWLAAHPESVNDVLNFNESFVFFKFNENDLPCGNIRVPLTPTRSFAADQSIYPGGTILLIDMPVPSNASQNDAAASQAKFTQVGVVQDVGGAIKSEKRIDLYWGAGGKAGQIAGYTKQMGDIYVLIPKNRSAEQIGTVYKSPSVVGVN